MENKMPEKKESPAAPAKKVDEPMQTVYTHGKKYRIPVSMKIEDFLKAKFPSEYK